LHYSASQRSVKPRIIYLHFTADSLGLSLFSFFLAQ